MLWKIEDTESQQLSFSKELLVLDRLKYLSSFLEGKNIEKMRESKRVTEAVISLMNIIWLSHCIIYKIKIMWVLSFAYCLQIFSVWSQNSHFFKKPKCFLYGFHIKPSEIILLSTDTLCFLSILFQTIFSVRKFPLTFWSLLKISFLRNLNFPDVRDLKTSSCIVIWSMF